MNLQYDCILFSPDSKIFRERLIRGLMPMSNLPMLGWSNRPIPIPIPMFKTGCQPVVRNTHMKNAAKCNTCKDKIGSVLIVILALHFCVRALLILFFLSPAQTLHVKSRICWKPAFIPPLCRPVLFISATQVKYLV